VLLTGFRERKWGKEMQERGKILFQLFPNLEKILALKTSIFSSGELTKFILSTGFYELPNNLSFI